MAVGNTGNLDKKQLTETDIRTKFITRAIIGSNWDLMTQIREEAFFTNGRVIVRGKTVRRGKAKKADYLLDYKPNLPLAVVEAKDNNHSVGDGMQQALEYAETLDNVTKAARIEEQIPEAYVSQHIALTRPRWSEMSEWLHLCFISPGSVRGTLEQLAYGDKPGLNLNNIRDLVLPIPPLAEQRRIVAKVDQLMSLVDELKTQLATSRATAANLLEAIVAELTASAA
jgi:type I site-specific restriction endonuclease